MQLKFTVLGPPVGKQRARVFTRGGKTRAVTPERTRKYEATVRNMASLHTCREWPLDRRYRLRVEFTGRCDGDNVLKAVSDACEGVLYANDRQVAECTAVRLEGKPPRTIITCEVLP